MFSDDYMHCFSLIDLRPRWKELFNMIDRRKYHKEKPGKLLNLFCYLCLHQSKCTWNENSRDYNQAVVKLGEGGLGAQPPASHWVERSEDE